jgi:hypothetical protein
VGDKGIVLQYRAAQVDLVAVVLMVEAQRQLLAQELQIKDMQGALVKYLLI